MKYSKITNVFIVILVVLLSTMNVTAKTIAPNITCNEFGCIINSNVARTLKPTTQYYSQTDSRWTSVPMKRTDGSSCGTIGGVGCALTSFSMIVQTYGDKDGDSNLLYTPITVNQHLPQTCSFDPTGWASSYNSIVQYVGSQTIDTAYKSDKVYLRRIIAQQIANGNIVIVYGYDAQSNGTHFMLAYGYSRIVDVYDTGYIAVKSASEISINDPGYSARKELSDFMDKFEEVRKVYYFREV